VRQLQASPVVVNSKLDLVLPPNKMFTLRAPDVFAGNTKTVMQPPHRDKTISESKALDEFYLDHNSEMIYDLHEGVFKWWPKVDTTLTEKILKEE